MTKNKFFNKINEIILANISASHLRHNKHKFLIIAGTKYLMPAIYAGFTYQENIILVHDVNGKNSLSIYELVALDTKK